MQIRTGVNESERLSNRYEKILYTGLTALLLWPIWANKYFLTLDGPCHLYNSAVLLDFWRNIDTPFFLRFYRHNPYIDPNWFSHISLACLMRFFSPQLSEKIFLSAYVLCFLLGSRWLIIYINPANKLLAFIPFLFVYHHVFQMGFYNFSFSLAWMILTWLFFLKYMDVWKAYIFIPAGACIFSLTYLAHPVGYLLACAAIGLMILIDAMKQSGSIPDFLRIFFKRFIVVFAAMLPSLLLLTYFLIRRSSIPMAETQDSIATLKTELTHLTSIINLTSGENQFARIAFLFMLSITTFAVFSKIYSRTFNRFDSFLILTVCLVVFYFKAPSGIAGAGMVNERLQIIPFVVIPFWLASVTMPRWLPMLTGGISIILIVCLMSVRIPVHRLCSDAIEEYMSLTPYIKAESTVIPLSYAHNGKTPDGKMIADRTWIFFHAADYLGTQKPLIMMGNYEAMMGYFPLIWKGDKNPFEHLCENDGIETVPPRIDIARYEKESSEKVDYVITLCLDSEYMGHPNTVDLFNQLNKDYVKTYTSKYGRAVLYQRR